MINVEILKKELLKQDSVESCFNDEYREMRQKKNFTKKCHIRKEREDYYDTNYI